MRNTHILIVDDEKEIGEEIAEFLEYLGFTVSVATSADQALDRLKKLWGLKL
ncbi:MAG: hypothetical protein AAED33_05645 [Paracoccaceae bacterium]|jgi:DNA-binding response OmpR family regulator